MSNTEPHRIIGIARSTCCLPTGLPILFYFLDSPVLDVTGG